ncbi:molybdate transport system substrate-binding protein [Desulfobaculum xiamenense]|uniref:Molybdate transport system substrate-binding protein n=1 Tax=Desulfobaculum xiamenense TaxID=995050 RepID=A0A846QJ24_9BACT|nr:molybdate ABC transporter substrate-binding protein [Desulfobaculum xiamenense]NJB66472.1 molybdate transport system substrate-binding protein [Desulfobaculum xiamenense]
MKRIFALVLAACLVLPATARAADLLIAQAANFMPAMQEIIPAFKAATGLEAQATYTSTGKLYGQITNGAPFDVFLSADERRPAMLHEAGQADAPFVYAKGRVVLWSSDPAIASRPWVESVKDQKLARIAIANTETAPYGTSAMVALKAVGLWDAVQPRLAHAQSIAQAFQYAQTGAADAGFCAYSSTFTDAGRKGGFVMIDEAPAIIQSACVLKNAEHRDAALAFVKFLATPEVQSIKAKYGYE